MLPGVAVVVMTDSQVAYNVAPERLFENVAYALDTSLILAP